MEFNKNVIILSFIFSVIVLVILTSRTIQHNQNSMTDISSLEKDKIEYLISNINYTIDMVQLVIIDGKMDFHNIDIESIIEPITRNSDLLNISILPDGIVKHIYPIEGNEKAIGDNIYLMPQRKAEINHALKSKKTIINGPYILSQGIKGIIARKAIFNHDDTIWGFIAIVLNLDNIVKNLSFSELKDQGYSIELSATVNQLNEVVIYNSIYNSNVINNTLNNLLHIDILSQDIELPNGKWTFSIRKDISSAQLLSNLQTSLITFLVVFLLLNTFSKTKSQIFIDELTSSKNRKFLDTLNNLNKFIVFYIDINDFKEINDNFGHYIGDKYLIKFAETIRQNIKQNDYLIRVGGDEFIILFPNVDEEYLIFAFIEYLTNLKESGIYLTYNKKPMTFSFGYSSSQEDCNLKTCINLADERMYNQKNAHKIGSVAKF